MNTTNRTLVEARTNLINVAQRFLADGKFKVGEEKLIHCEHQGSVGVGDVYRWEYSAEAHYSPECEAGARRVIEEMKREGWTFKERNVGDGDRDYTTSRAGQPLAGVTIPTDHNRTISASGSSECVRDANPPTARPRSLEPPQEP